MLFLENSQIGTCFSLNTRFGYIFSHRGGGDPGGLKKKYLPRVVSEIPGPPCCDFVHFPAFLKQPVELQWSALFFMSAQIEQYTMEIEKIYKLDQCYCNFLNLAN